MRRAHHEEPDATASLLGAPYDEATAEEGEPLPALERHWPAALIPYMHPATVAAEASMYWEADPADEAALLEEVCAFVCVCVWGGVVGRGSDWWRAWCRGGG